LTIESRVSRTQYQFTLADADLKQLSVWTPRLVERMQELPQLRDVASDLQDRGLQAMLSIDRDAAARLGVTAAEIDSTLYSAFGQRIVSTIFTQTDQTRVVLEAKQDVRQGVEGLQDIYIDTPGGRQIPLSAVTTLSERSGDDFLQSCAGRRAGAGGRSD
jgi:multidrug efflux pump